MKAITTIWLLIDVLWLTGYFVHGQKDCSKCERDYDCKNKNYICGNYGCCRLLGKNDGEAGSKCSHRSDCKEGLQCVGREPGVGGTCLTLFAEKKKTCIDSPMCKAGLYCNTKKKRCEKLLPLGKRCKSSDQCENSHCLPSVFSTSKLQGNIQGEVSQYKTYCAVRSKRQGESCKPKKTHCAGKNLICTRGGGGFGRRFGNIRGKRQAKRRKISPRKGYYTCQDMGSGEGTELPCDHYSQCPCGEACFNLRRRTWVQKPYPGNPQTNSTIPALGQFGLGQSRKPGVCRRADCGVRDCTVYGFNTLYQCKEDKVCFPSAKTMNDVYGDQPSINDFVGGFPGGNFGLGGNPRRSGNFPRNNNNYNNYDNYYNNY